MTRRDHCPVCKENVHDYDVKCNECYISLCHDCATTYDAKSRISIIHARFNVLRKPNITIKELNQYYLDLETEITDEFINKMRKKNYYEIYENSINNIEEIVNYYKNNDNINKEIEENDLIVLKKCVENICECFDYFEFIPFICLMCHKGIKITY